MSEAPLELTPVTADLDNPTVEKELLEAKTDKEFTDATLDDVLAAASSQAGGGKETKEEREKEERRAAKKRKADEALGDDGAEGPAGAGAGSAAPSEGPEAKRVATAAPSSEPVSLTRRAVTDMIQAFDTMTGDAKAALDSAAATLIGLVPKLAKGAVVGAGTTFAINNPTLFAHLVRVLTNAAKFAINMRATADWDQYTLAIEQIARHLGSLGETIRDVGLNSPAFVITSALLIMRYRASQANTTIAQLLVDDARRLTGGAKAIAEVTGEGAAGAGAGASSLTSALGSAAEVAWSAFVNAYGAVRARSVAAWEQARQAANVEPLRELGKRALEGMPKGKGAEEIQSAVRSVGAPAAEGGPGGIALVPSKGPREIKAALDAMRGIKPLPPQEEKAAEAMEVEPTPLPAIRTPPSVRGFSPPSPPAGRAVPGAAMEPKGEGSGEPDVTMTTGQPAPGPMDEDKPTKGGRRKTPKNKRKTYRKKGKKTRGKTRGRRSFIY